jgi:hypothetical protein
LYAVRHQTLELVLVRTAEDFDEEDSQRPLGVPIPLSILTRADEVIEQSSTQKFCFPHNSTDQAQPPRGMAWFGAF